MTRLADVTGLGGLGVPTFQAVRPWARSLTVSQGKGLTPMAAAVSALLEAVELASAERLPPPRSTASLRSLGRDAWATWRGGACDPLLVALDPDRVRGWLGGRDLLSGRAMPVPHDMLLLDMTRPPPPDAPRTSAGLATGNTYFEATAGGLAELLEHDLSVRFDRSSPAERRAAELDLHSVDDRFARPLLEGMGRHGFAVRAWSLGQDAGIAAFHCAMFQRRGRRSDMPPAGGSGCHPDRSVALLRALLEAAQSQAGLVAGARDDLGMDDYRGGAERWMQIIFGGLSFGPGPLAWRDAPDHIGTCAEQDLDVLLATAARLSSSPVIAVRHTDPHPELSLAHVVAPGLLKSGRTRTGERSAAREVGRAPMIGKVRRGSRPVVFAGPSLPPGFRNAEIELRPPAVCGDLARLLERPPPAVGLIDGCFEIAPTVWHKEVLDLLAHGVCVSGAASLGAIRAAELATFGMRGVGAIFMAYAAGAIRRDDAVMLDHAPAELDHRALTLALVDAEAALLQVAMPGVERRMLQRIARTLSYKERTWPLCLRLFAERAGRTASVDATALAAVPSLKQRDAIALVAALTGSARFPPPPRPPLTGHYLRLLATTRRPEQPPDRLGASADAPAA